MVNYVKKEKELSMYCIESIKILCKPAIILSLIALPLSVYYLVIGYVVDSEALILGFSKYSNCDSIIANCSFLHL